MKKAYAVLILLGLLLITAPASAKQSILVVDDDGANCKNAGFETIQEAIDAATGGEIIKICSGTYAGALVDKSVKIVGAGDVLIDEGPAHSSGLFQGFRLLAGSDGTDISHLTFAVDLVIMNGAAVDDVSIHHNTFINSIQAISNWGGSGWQISHNNIVDLRTRNGGGIGILVADWTGGTVENNVVSHNTISGMLYVDPVDGGGYSGTGIVIYADFRGGADGASAIKNISVVKNKISLVSDTPSVVDVVAFEMTDTRDEKSQIVIFDNAIGFNDFRGTELQISLAPENLDEYNDISRNLGENRGHGLHPSLFEPGGN